MYLRFVTPDIDEDSQKELGVFRAAYRLRDRGELYGYEEDHLDAVRTWFNNNLEKPTRFTSSKPPSIESRVRRSLGSRTLRPNT
jgi:hypothetical protein